MSIHSTCIWGMEFRIQRTALGAIIFITEVLSQERDINDSAPRQIVVIGSGSKGDGIIVGAGACLFARYQRWWVRTGKKGVRKAMYLQPWAVHLDSYHVRS